MTFHTSLPKNFGCISIFSLLVLVFHLSFFICFAEEPPEMVWQRRYYKPSGAFDSYGVAVDSRGNVYVSGYASTGSNNDFLLLKYNSSGDTAWIKKYDCGIGDFGMGIAVDHAGYIYMTGQSWNGANWDFLTFKCNASGETLWQMRYDGGSGDGGFGIAVERAAGESGNVYVSGTSTADDFGDYFLIKYDASGNTVWCRRYDRSIWDHGYGVAVDGCGNVCMTGYTLGTNIRDYLTVKYDSSGNTVWERIYDSGHDDASIGIAVDSSNSVYVTGQSWNGTNWDYLTVKYNSNGDTIWVKRYDRGETDLGYAIAVDSYNNIYVTGQSWNGTSYDFLTIKYNSSGDVLWVKSYDGGETDGGYAIAVDPMGYVYVTGQSWNGVNYEYLTIKYLQHLTPGVVPSGIAGEVRIGSTGGKGIVYAEKGEQAVISFKPASAGKVSVRIYTLNGLKVWEREYDSPGPDDLHNFILWDCNNIEGGNACSGTYLVYVEGPGIKAVKKVLIMR